MRIKALHEWTLTPAQARNLQTRLAARILTSNPDLSPRIVAGADISFERHSSQAFAGVVLLDAESLETLGEFWSQGKIEFPYVPGLLSFREAPLLLETFRKASPAPDLIFFDGQGIAHPRGMGLASHMGLFLDTPTIGCAKSRLVGTYQEPGDKRGSHSPLLDKSSEELGAVVRTREGCKPMFISIGHKIDLTSAVRWTLRCTDRYRIPEPTRRAHLLVNTLRRKFR